MAQGNRPTGRTKRVTAGGGRVQKQGSGFGAARPVGGGSGAFGRGSAANGASGGGNRSTGGSLLALLLGAAALSGSGKRSSGCLKRILILALIVIVIAFVVRNCGGLGSMLGSLGGESLLGENVQGEQPQLSVPSDPQENTLGSLLNGYLDYNQQTEAQSSSVSTASDSLWADGGEDAYSAHEADFSVDSRARARYTSLAGNGDDTVTIMVYMCATDLESKNGMATADLNEMLYATLSDKVNILIETGGCTAWKNTSIKAKTNQIHRISTKGFQTLESNLGKQSMVDPDTLSDFIQYCGQNYPASRNILILWDHGGGSITGYGYDELYPSDSMSLDEIDTALKDGGVQFDCIGFDACLMGTLETAFVCARYADYMLASEAVEPGCGWYYTDFLTALSENTSMSTIALGKKIIDDYQVASKKAAPKNYATLSLIDLAEMSGTLPAALSAFSTSTTALIDNDQYQTVSAARSGARDFSSSSKINQIDMIHFAKNLGTDESIALAQVLSGMVKYNRISANITDANGISVYFPLNRLSGVNTALTTLERIEMNEEYTACVKSFASVAAGGQVVSGGSGSVLDVLLGGTGSSAAGDLLSGLAGSTSSGSGSADAMTLLLESFLSGGSSGSLGISGDALSWLDSDRVRASASYYAENRLDTADLVLSQKDGRQVLALDEDKWALVSDLAMSVFVDDGEGYIDLGLDNVMEYTDAGDLVMEYDGTWLSVNGQVVAYYLETSAENGDAYRYTGRIPAYIDAKRMDIIVVFDNDYPYGRVEGARTVYANGETQALGKGIEAIAPGASIVFLCDFYGCDGTFSDSYQLNDTMAAPVEWEISNVPIGDYPALMCYRVTDLYGNFFWTPTVEQ